jgi:uncharacterized SAM-binding protein YcdF (DUF218 family)
MSLPLRPLPLTLRPLRFQVLGFGFLLSAFQISAFNLPPMSFLYSILLKLLYPTSLCLVLLLAAAAFRKHERLRRLCFWTAVAVLLVCGNGWLVRGLTKHLEWQYLPPNPVPQADCILVLSGGIMPRIPPRPTIEVAEAGDRLLYGAYLYRQRKAPRIICTGNVATGGISLRPASENMAEFLDLLGVPKEAIILESESENTREHARNLQPMFQEKGFKRVLLVTSAMHMPRAFGVFQKQCPGIEFIPAPTDFHATEKQIPTPWYRELVAIIPTPKHLLDFSEVMHEYLGSFYYRLRGWM